MTPYFPKAMILTSLLTLAACGGGGGDGDGSGGGGTPVPGSNGLNYGMAGQQLEDAEGVAVSMSSASFQVGSGPDIGGATITVNANFFDGGTQNLDGTIQIFGQSVTITNGVGALSTGEEVRLTYEPNRSGTYAAAVDATVSSLNDINGEAAYVFGFETNPATVNARTAGVVTYSGDFQATGSVGGSAALTEYEGGITVVVSFADDDADFTLDGTFNGTQNVDLGRNNVNFSGYSITTGLNCTSGCSGTGSSVDATFYGPNADELGGVLEIDINVNGVGAYDGVGTFVIDPNP